MAYRRKLYDSVEALQADLDAFLTFYNEARRTGTARRPHARPDLHRSLARPEGAPVAAQAPVLQLTATRPSVRSSPAMYR